MKVWELCNKIAGTNSDYNEIKSWAYQNRIYPDEFVENFAEAGFISEDCAWAKELNKLAKETEQLDDAWLSDFLLSDVEDEKRA